MDYRLVLFIILTIPLFTNQVLQAEATTKEEQAKNKLELEKARIQAHANANPPRPEPVQGYKIKMIAVMLSNSCLVSIKNNSTTKCPSYDSLVKYDTTTPSFSGKFVTKNGHLYRDGSHVKKDSIYAFSKNYIICVDCKHASLEKYKQIWIVPQLDLYKDSSTKITNNTINYFHTINVRDCMIASIEYSDALLNNTINYLKSDCKEKGFDNKITDKRPYTKFDISTTKAYKDSQYMKQAKEIAKKLAEEYCKKQGSKCK